MSDNGPQMREGTTREFLALCCIASRFGRPGTPTDQAWIETLFGHIKTEWPHLEKITDPNTLRAELDIARNDCNTHRLHTSLGNQTPDDYEHHYRHTMRRRCREPITVAGLMINITGLRPAQHPCNSTKTNRPEPTEKQSLRGNVGSGVVEGP